ncbi:MAG: YidC/Oxa1 family membrane protein insertase [Treponema sp.]|nr:YidC/Oxa1 family membrane protein insertase [Treponema sp.]
MASLIYTLVIYPLYLIIEVIYRLFLKITSNIGLSVIGVSVGITLLCLPLYAVAEHWQQVERDKQKGMKGDLDHIKDAFSGDERYMMTQAYYRENHYSPIMALRSSFGLLIQVPFFMAAYQFLSQLETLKGVSFLFIRDMGVPDATFHIGSFPVNVLPIAMTLINMVAGAIYTKGLAAREKIQVHGMAVIFLAILYNSPSGLVLYWTMNNVFSLVKNIFYKLKNPLKVFWICASLVCLFGVAYINFFFEAKKIYKAAFTGLLVLVLVSPLFVKGAQKLLDTVLSPLVQNKKERRGLFFVSAILLFVLFGLAIPSSLISSSAAEFTGLGGHDSPFYYIGNTALQAAAIFLFWFPCVYFLFNKKVQALMAAGAAFLAVAALLNAYPFMLRYGDISASLTFLNITDFKSLSPVSLLNLFALAAAAVLCALSFKIKKVNVLGSAALVVCLALAGSFVANAISIQKNSSEALAAAQKQQGKVELKPIYHLSKNHPNVILMMLDRATAAKVQEIFNEAPELTEQYTGFVFYDNAAAFNGHTLLGAPALFGGYEYAPAQMQRRKDVTRQQKVNESQLVLARIFNETLGYKASVNDPTWINSSNYCDLSFLQGYDIDGHQTIGTYTQQWYKTHPESAGLDSTEEILKRNLLFFSLFRCSPICLREAIYLNGTYFNSKEDIRDAKKIIDNYSALDFLPQLTDIQETKSGSYTSILNEMTHDDFFFEAPDYVPSKTPKNRGTSKYKDDGTYHTQMAAFKRVGAWLDWLKKNGVYDNTRIIIASDHGGNGSEDCMEPDAALDSKLAGISYRGRGHYHPLFMFKDFNAKGPLVLDQTFMTNADAASLLLRGLLDKPVNPFTQKEIPLDTRPLKKDGVIITTCDKHLPHAHKDPYLFDIKKNEWWLVRDNIFKASSWTQIEPPEGTR